MTCECPYVTGGEPDEQLIQHTLECDLEQQLAERDAEPLSVCCHASPIDEIDGNGIGFCSLCKEPVPFEVHQD